MLPRAPAPAIPRPSAPSTAPRCAPSSRAAGATRLGPARSRRGCGSSACADVSGTRRASTGSSSPRTCATPRRSFGNAPGFTATVVAGGGAGRRRDDRRLLRDRPRADAAAAVRRSPSAGPALAVRAAARATCAASSRPRTSATGRRAATSFESMAVWRNLAFNLSGAGDPERLEGCAVSDELFPLLGVRPLLGRTLGADDDREGAPAAIVLGYRLWQDRFGGDAARARPPPDPRRRVLRGRRGHAARLPLPDARDRVLDGHAASPPDMYEDRGNTFLYGIARLKPGVHARAGPGRDDASWPRSSSARTRRRTRGSAPRSSACATRSRRSRALMVTALLGAALCVLLIACTNLASLLLARALVRRQELAVRDGARRGPRAAAAPAPDGERAPGGAGRPAGRRCSPSRRRPLLARLVPTSLPIASAPAGGPARARASPR